MMRSTDSRASGNLYAACKKNRTASSSKTTKMIPSRAIPCSGAMAAGPPW